MITSLAYYFAPDRSYRLVTTIIGYITMYWLHSVNFVLVSVFGSNKRLRSSLELFGFGRDGLIAGTTSIIICSSSH